MLCTIRQSRHSSAAAASRPDCLPRKPALPAADRPVPLGEQLGPTKGRIADRCAKEFKVVENFRRTIRVTQQSSRKARSKVCRTKATNCSWLTLSQVEHQTHAGCWLLDLG